MLETVNMLTQTALVTRLLMLKLLLHYRKTNVIEPAQDLEMSRTARTLIRMAVLKVITSVLYDFLKPLSSERWFLRGPLDGCQTADCNCEMLRVIPKISPVHEALACAVYVLEAVMYCIFFSFFLYWQSIITNYEPICWVVQYNM
jgi:hypothetical protein